VTAERANPPDLDQLADFAAGLLDGTPEGAAIAEQIERDPAAARLHAALIHADNVVRAELRALAAPTMPADVFARLDAALAAESNAEAATAEEVDSRQLRPQADSGADSDGDTGTGRVVPLHRRRTWWMGGGAAAAGIALIAAGAVGFGMFTQTKHGTQEGSTAASAPHTDLKSVPPGVPSRAEGSLGETASGTEYQSASLAVQIPALLGVSQDRGERKFASGTPTAEAALQRLLSPTELANCLAALGAVGRPLAIDYARYAGNPAVVIVLPSKATPSVVDVAIVGPDCGRSGSDSRLRTTVPVTR
jgi:hypothetical protein